ncbi:hypothetical protein [Amycolatopsis sp. NPDC058986]|uniref:WXG100 family type VII secretion target n=1 Tax=unclassified Amycolatopsis TaxID=2618356 RepID=UPI0036702110
MAKHHGGPGHSTPGHGKPGQHPAPGHPKPGQPHQDPEHRQQRPGHDEEKPDRKRGHEDEDKKGKEDKKKRDEDPKDDPKDDSPSAPGGDSSDAPTTPSGGQGAYGLDDGSDVIALLEPPATDASGDIKALLADADIKVQAVDWVFQKIAGHSLIDLVIKPITGDFTKIAADAEAWRTISDAMKQFSETMVRNAEIVGEHWEGPSSTAHQAYVNVGWRVALMAEAGIAQAIGKGFDALADGSRKLAAKALDLLAKLIDTLIEIAAKACVPIAGWIAETTTIWRAFQLLSLILDVIEMIKDIISRVQQLWESIQNLGSQLKQIKDIITGGGDKPGDTTPSGDGGGDEPPPQPRGGDDSPPERREEPTTPSGSDEKPPRAEEKCKRCGGPLDGNGKCPQCDRRRQRPDDHKCKRCDGPLDEHGKCPRCDRQRQRPSSRCSKCGKEGDWGSSHVCPDCRRKDRCSRCGAQLRPGVPHTCRKPPSKPGPRPKRK